MGGIKCLVVIWEYFGDFKNDGKPEICNNNQYCMLTKITSY
jgi:hypothetical protein